MYQFPETEPLSANQDYYILLRFLTDVNWCANLNSLQMNLKDMETSNDDIEMDKPITFYPNPASDYITLSYSGRLVVVDLQGISYMDRQVVAGETIDIRKLASGFYLINMISDGKSIVTKMIKR